MLTKENLTSIGLCIDNEYLDKYLDIINNKQTLEGNIQKHHIIPRYYYKTNNLDLDNTEDNIAFLTFRNHVLAHYYLSLCSAKKIYEIYNINALTGMIKRDNTICEGDLIQLLEKYDDLYSDYIEYKRNKIYEIAPWEYVDYANKHCRHSDESYAKASKSMLGKYKGMKHVSLGDFEKVVSVDDLPLYLEAGWKQSRSDKTRASLKANWNKDGNRPIRRGYHQTDKQKKAVSEANSHPRSEESKEKQSSSLREGIANNKYVWMRKEGKPGTSRIINGSDKMYDYLNQGYHICERRNKNK